MISCDLINMSDNSSGFFVLPGLAQSAPAQLRDLLPVRFRAESTLPLKTPSFKPHFCIRLMKFIAVKRLCRERPVMACGGWDGGAPDCGGHSGVRLLLLALELESWYGEISIGEEPR